MFGSLFHILIDLLIRLLGGRLVLKLQKQAARLILNKRIQDSNSEEMFKMLNWLPFHHRILFHQAVFAYKATNNLLPSKLCQYFKPCQKTTNYLLRSCSKKDFFKSRRHLKSIISKSINTWNNLPFDVKNSPTLGTFKLRLKSFLKNLDLKTYSLDLT